MNVTQQSVAQAPGPFIFACSGAADVGEIADRAARQLMFDGVGKMFCLAGIGGQVPHVMEKTHGAAGLLVIDGCEKECGKACLSRAGFIEFGHVRLNDHGMEKGKTPATEQNVQRVRQIAGQVLATVRCCREGAVRCSD